MSEKTPGKIILDPSKINGQPKQAEKVCHRTIRGEVVPQEFMVLNPVTGKSERSVRMDLKAVNVTCAKDACMMWNAEASECFDVTSARALARLNAQVDILDGLMRLGAPGRAD